MMAERGRSQSFSDRWQGGSNEEQDVRVTEVAINNLRLLIDHLVGYTEFRQWRVWLVTSWRSRPYG